MERTPIQEALARLRKQRDADYFRPWKPGQKLTDAELIWDYISKLERKLSLTQDELFIHTYEDRMGGQFSSADYEQPARSEQGIFG